MSSQWLPGGIYLSCEAALLTADGDIGCETVSETNRSISKRIFIDNVEYVFEVSSIGSRDVFDLASENIIGASPKDKGLYSVCLAVGTFL